MLRTREAGKRMIAVRIYMVVQLAVEGWLVSSFLFYVARLNFRLLMFRFPCRVWGSTSLDGVTKTHIQDLSSFLIAVWLSPDMDSYTRMGINFTLRS
jgi:hypothetical protein